MKFFGLPDKKYLYDVFNFLIADTKFPIQEINCVPKYIIL